MRKEGYEDVFARVSVEPGKTFSLTKKLSISKRVCSISSVPSGASVYLDGKYKGVTPVVFHVEEGRHKLTIKKSGYSTVSKEINASSETASVIEEKLHFSLFTYFTATLIMLVTGIILKRNPEKLKFKFPIKTPEDGRVLKKLQEGAGKREVKVRVEEKKRQKKQK